MPLVPQDITYLEKRNPEANESKFWAIRFEPTTKGAKMALHVWWGRIGTKGQDKVFDDYVTDNECCQDARKRAEMKLREGYVPITGSLAWWPEFMKLADRAPQAPGYQGTSADGWPIVNGIERRPPVRGKYARNPDIVEMQARRTRAFQEVRAARVREFKASRATELPLAVECGIDMGRARDRTVVTVVQISNDRVIDFED